MSSTMFLYILMFFRPAFEYLGVDLEERKASLISKVLNCINPVCGFTLLQRCIFLFYVHFSYVCDNSTRSYGLAA